MDVLAEASIAASTKETDAAAILQTLFEHRQSPSQFVTDDTEPPMASPTSEDYLETHAPPQQWARSEDDLLRRLATAHGLAHGTVGKGRASGDAQGMSDEMQVWDDIASQFEGRTAAQCASRYQKVLNPENVKGPWCPTEDNQLIDLVRQYGGKHWARIASMLPGRTGKQCRERWCNNLDPSLKKGAWTGDEDQIILKMHAKLGTRWAEIAKSLPGRSDNSVKNRWYSTCSRVLRQQQEAAENGGVVALVDGARVAVEASRVNSDESADLEECSDGVSAPPAGKRARAGARDASTPSPRAASPRDLVSPRGDRKRKSSSSATPPQKEREAPGSRRVPEPSGSSVINMPPSWPRLLVDLPKGDDASVPESALSAEIA